ncbi:WSC-domain-containing protein [Xylariomycetidae sp. FL0641]|nr:WSC-domain-containing protein [Xylariomycetidae sp. FL0641]
MRTMPKGKLGLGAIVILLAAHATAYWRMVCGLSQSSRIDPVVFPGLVSPHAHKISGASNINATATFDSLQSAECSTCSVQADKSAYWTPQLYYQHADGTFEDVPNGGTVVYYLGRGENRSNIEPFPPGFKMLSGNPYLRSNDTASFTYEDPDSGIAGRLVSDRVSFACLDSSGGIPEQNYMFRTDCSDGLRAQIHFPSCWNGGRYQEDQSHVEYMSQIDNGVCPPTHPHQLIHLFFEVIYGVNSVQKEAGGRFVFAQGDPTGFGFHGDFINGWDPDVLADAIAQCVNNDALNGQVPLCPPLAESDDPFYDTNCPERPPLLDEQVKGRIPQLPGCNNTPLVRFNPSIGETLGGSAWTFSGCAVEPQNGRVLTGPHSSSPNMTIELCTGFCSGQGYGLAGTEYSQECYCGATTGAANLTECVGLAKMQCAGNKTEWCGAPGLLGVWRDAGAAAPPPLVPGSSTTADGAATYAGCFGDPANGARALAGDRTADANMTNEACVGYCKARGFALAGTEYGRECYCGNTNNGTLLADGEQRELTVN